MGRPSSTRCEPQASTSRAIATCSLKGFSTWRVEARAEVTVPDVVAADVVFDVAVSGAVGPRDVLVLVRAEAPDEGAETIGPPKRIYTATVGFRAPAEPGAYEVRYVTGDGRIAQRFPVAVR